MATMTIDDLSSDVQLRLDLNSKAKAKETIQAVLGAVSDRLTSNQYSAGFEIRLHGFGTFKVKPIAEKGSRNPSTGESIILPARNKVVFKLTKTLADLGK